MALFKELRHRARHVAAPVICVSLVLYFGFHLFQGERGLAAWIQISREIAAARAELADLKAEQAALSAKVGALRPEHLDLDALDERARAMLNLAKPEELVILMPGNSE